MWPEGRTVAFGRPLIGVSATGKTLAQTTVIAPPPPPEPAAAALCPDPAALEEARQEGYQRGFKDSANEFDFARSVFKNCAEALQAQLRRTGQNLDETAVKLALEIAAKLLERELQNPAALSAAALNALNLVPHDDKIVLRVHPATRHALLKHAEGQDELELPPHVSMIVDQTVEPGGFIVQTPAENWDAQISSRMALLTHELLGDDRPEINTVPPASSPPVTEAGAQ